MLPMVGTGSLFRTKWAAVAGKMGLMQKSKVLGFGSGPYFLLFLLHGRPAQSG